MTARATITPEQAAREDWDVVVIGAGPAGSVAARGLVGREMKTLLVDRRSFPRDKVCGSCISLRALSLLGRAGLSAQIDELPGVPLGRAKVFTKARSFEVSLPGGRAISRADLDQALVKAAIAEGAHFLPQVKASVCAEHGSKNKPARLIELHNSQTGPVRIESSAVVAADGLGHPSLRGLPEFTDRIRRQARLGLGATLSSQVSGFDLGSVMMAVGRAGYVGAVRLSSGQLHVAASVDHSALRTSTGLADLISQILHEAKLPAIPELSKADWQGTIPLTRRTATVAAGRIFLVGDAAGYVEPFTGEGITWALTTGIAVPSFVRQAVLQSSPLSEHAWRRSHRRLLGRSQDCCRMLAWVLRHRHLASAAAGLMSLVPALPQFLANQLNQPFAATERDFA